MSNSTIQQLFSAQEVIDNLIANLTRNYLFPDKVPQIAQILRQKLASGAYDGITQGDEFAKAITEDLLTGSQDKHLRLRYQPEGVAPSNDVHQYYTVEEIEHIRSKKGKNYGLKKLEILEGNIGYFRFDEFVHPAIAGESMQAAMTFLTHTRALIIDLRYNGGGESTMVHFLCSYFFDTVQSEYVQLNGFYERKKDRTQYFNILPYVPGPLYLEKPVYLLTSKKTFSAAEDFTYNFQQLKRGCIIGERTGGGAHSGWRQRITETFSAFVPDLRSVSPISGTNWEGTGIEPDVAVGQEESLQVAYDAALVAVK